VGRNSWTQISENKVYGPRWEVRKSLRTHGAFHSRLNQQNCYLLACYHRTLVKLRTLPVARLLISELLPILMQRTLRQTHYLPFVAYVGVAVNFLV
jgi:hypothetical protein